MEWTRSETLALALPKCSHCRGTGIYVGFRKRLTPCPCVLRGIFRACLNRFRECALKEKRLSHPSLERCEGKSGHMVWSRKDEEYVADFVLVTRRALNEQEHKLFRYHFLLGADWRLCVRQLKIDRGSFFHSIYRIEQKLGRIYRELQPYALFPLDEYFCSGTRDRMEASEPLPKVVPIRPPLRKKSGEEVLNKRKVA